MKPGLFAKKAVVVAGAMLVLAGSSFAGDVKGKVNVQGLRSAGNIAVYIDAIPDKKFDPPKEHVVVDQKKMEFIPHVVVILQGTTVDFSNSDSVGHNVYWPSISGNKKEGHNLGTWPKGEKRSFTFNTPGVVPLLCNVHPEMSGYIVVTPTPYFAETDANGNYKIENVPNGKYSVVAWHEGMKTQSKSAEVASTVTVDFSLAK